MNLLEIQAVSKHYGQHTALHEVSLNVGQGRIFGLLGPNGAGKTSLIRIINQITAPDSGRVLLNGEPLHPRHVRQIGYLPEERGLYPKMKVHEHLLYLARLRDLAPAEAKKRIGFWLKRFDALDWQNKKVEELSKGMAQKIQFIATVIHQPSLLIFDEPFTGFDPVNTETIKNEIRRLRDEGATVIFSTHRMESVEEICDDIALIHHGRKILEGQLPEVQRAYHNHQYEVVLGREAQLPDQLRLAELLERQERHGRLHLRLSAPEADTNQLLRELMDYGRVVSFREKLPSLHEIFIQKVAP